MLGIDIKKLGFLPGTGKGELVGIDFSGNKLKLVCANAFANKREVTNIISRDITGLSDVDISKIVRSCVGELGLKNPKIINVLPSHLVITKNIEIPSVDHNEIKEIINLQAGRHTPYSREEIIIDYIGIGTYKHSYTKILLVIVARSVVKRQFEILDRAGLRLENILLVPEGLAWAASRILKIDTQNAPVSIVHIDDTFTDFSVVFREKVVFIRSISMGAQGLVTDAEKNGLRFCEEIKRSLEAYQYEDIEKIPQLLVLTGAVEEVKSLEDVLGGSLHIPIKIIPYLKNLTLLEPASRGASLAKNSSFLSLIAPMFAWQELKINLVPEELKLRKSLEDRGRDLIKTGILVLVVFVFMFFIFISKIYFKTAYLKDLTVRFNSLNQDAQNLENDFTKISLIKNYLSGRGYSLEVLTELYSITPLDLQLNDIRFDEQGKLSIRGTAESMSIVFSFVDGLSKSRYFKDVKTKYTTKRKEGAKDVADFEINASLNKEAS